MSTSDPPLEYRYSDSSAPYIYGKLTPEYFGDPIPTAQKFTPPSEYKIILEDEHGQEVEMDMISMEASVNLRSHILRIKIKGNLIDVEIKNDEELE